MGLLRRLLLRLYRIPAREVTATPATFGLAAEDVDLAAADGTRVRGWFVPAATDRGRGPAVVVMHGWGSAAADLLPAVGTLTAAGLSTLLVDARGHGRSDPADFMSMPRFAEDVETTVAWLRDDPRVDPDRVGLVGHSVGAGACLLAAAHDPRIAAVVAIASMAHPAEMIGRSMRARRVPRRVERAVLHTIEHTIGHAFDDFAPLHTIGRVDAPVLVLHGMDDRTVPPRDARRLAAAGRDVTLRLVPDAGHDRLDDFLPSLPEVARHLATALATSPSLD